MCKVELNSNIHFHCEVCIGHHLLMYFNLLCLCIFLNSLLCDISDPFPHYPNVLHFSIFHFWTDSRLQTFESFSLDFVFADCLGWNHLHHFSHFDALPLPHIHYSRPLWNLLPCCSGCYWRTKDHIPI